MLVRSTGGTVAAAVGASPPTAALQSPLLTAAMGQRSWSATAAGCPSPSSILGPSPEAHTHWQKGQTGPLQGLKGSFVLDRSPTLPRPCLG